MKERERERRKREKDRETGSKRDKVMQIRKKESDKNNREKEKIITQRVIELHIKLLSNFISCFDHYDGKKTLVWNLWYDPTQHQPFEQAASAPIFD